MAIHQLSDHLINLIAAGEVVERPASVVKELVENSLDAGATRIDIALKEGGMQEISIVDDGTGMSQSDLSLCILRHATSKLADETSLGSIQTLGFRGEALSSIAAVSRLTIRSCSQESREGHAIKVDWGVASEMETVGMPRGTSICVQDLFLRVPARHKFLKSPATEMSNCQKVVKEISLGHPGVSFYLNHNNGKTNPYPSTDRPGRVREILKIEGNFLCIQESMGDVEIDAYLSPAHHISDRGELMFYVNSRSVKNRNLLSAVRSAYLETLGPHHEPSGAVFLNVRYDWVDVNVHPQKSEVRLLKGQELYGWIRAGIRKALAKRPSDVTPYVFKKDVFRNQPTSESFQEPVAREPSRHALEHALEHGSMHSLVHATEHAMENATKDAKEHATNSIAALAQEPVEWHETLLLKEEVSAYDPNPNEAAHSWKLPRLMNAAPIRYLGQLKASYLVCEDIEGLCLIDQHALHEKFRFEELVDSFKKGELKSQRLIVPKILSIPLDLIELSERAREPLGQLGMEFDSVGGSDVAIKSLPVGLSDEVCVQVFLDTFKMLQIDDGAVPNPESLYRPFLATVACHSVVTANQRLSDLEVQELLGMLPRIEMGWTCPHGRPVLFRLGFSEIEGYFRRT